jgi:hypothetical protein
MKSGEERPFRSAGDLSMKGKKKKKKRRKEKGDGKRKKTLRGILSHGNRLFGPVQ